MSVRSINAAGSISAKCARCYTDFLLDTGAEINIISQSFAKQCDLKPLEHCDLPIPEWMSGQSVYCYGAYSVEYQLTDSWGQLRVRTGTFFAIDKKGSPMVLGMPTLTEAGVQVDLGARKWRFPVDSDSITILEPQEFADSLGDKPIIYTVVYAGLS